MVKADETQTAGASASQRFSPGTAARLLRGRLGRFARNRSGAMAVEFALVAAPLLFMLFSIIELALVFLVSTTLESATTEAARTIRTGAIQTAGGATQTTFRDAICDRLGWLQDQCKTNLSVDVRTFTQFSNPTIPDPIVTSGSSRTFDPTKTTFVPGNPNDIVLVRAFYRWKLLTPYLNGGLERLNNGVTMMTAATTFRNEPY